MSQRIIRYIPEIRRIDILSRYETDNPHYREADLIITCTSCNDPREVIIDNLLSEQGVAELKAQIRRKEKSAASQSPAFSVECASLFSPDLDFSAAEIFRQGNAAEVCHHLAGGKGVLFFRTVSVGAEPGKTDFHFHWRFRGLSAW